MLWLILALLTALFAAFGDVLTKKNLKTIDEYIVSWGLRVLSFLFLIPVVVYYKIPPLGGDFLFALIVNGGLNLFITIIYMKALKLSDISIATPLITFTPLFLLLTSPLILREFQKPIGIVGVLLIVFGSYVLNFRHRHKGHLAPFKALLKEKGPRLMLLVAFLFSITSNFDKIGVKNSSPYFWVFSVNLFIACFLTPYIFYRIYSKKSTFNGIQRLIPLGFLSALTLLFQMTAISLTLVAYVISIKRLSALLGVVFGRYFFGEVGTIERFIGCCFMILGAVLIALA